MASNGGLDTGMFQISAVVYPGMFDREVQATIKIGGREITVIVSKDSVTFEQPLVEQGVAGELPVFLVGVDDKGVLIDLPGEPIGTSRRLRIPLPEFRKSFQSVP